MPRSDRALRLDPRRSCCRARRAVERRRGVRRAGAFRGEPRRGAAPGFRQRQSPRPGRGGSASPCDARSESPGTRGGGRAASEDSEPSSPWPMPSWPLRPETASAPDARSWTSATDRRTRSPHLQLVAKLELTQLYAATGQIKDALTEFDGAEALVKDLLRRAEASPAHVTGPAPASWLLTSLSRVGATLALATDDLGAAAAWSNRVTDSFWGPLCEAKLFLAEANHRQAAEALDQGPATVRPPRGDTPSRPGTGQGSRRPRERDVERGGRAPPGGRARNAADRRLRRERRFSSSSSCRRGASPTPGWSDCDTSSSRPGSHRVAGPVEPLTERERDVLRLLPSRLTLREIAAEMYVSQNTLKFHLRAIYRKLGVDSRAAAVQAARRLRLLPGA